MAHMRIGYNFAMVDRVGKLDGRSGLFDAEAASLDDVTVYSGVEIRKSVREFDFLPIESHRTVRELARLTDTRREILFIDRKKPADASLLQLKQSRHLARCIEMHL